MRGPDWLESTLAVCEGRFDLQQSGSFLTEGEVDGTPLSSAIRKTIPQRDRSTERPKRKRPSISRYLNRIELSFSSLMIDSTDCYCYPLDWSSWSLPLSN